MRCCVAAAALVALAAQLRAQGARVRVVDDVSGRPVAGALVTLEAGDRVAAQGLTTVTGARFLAAPPGAEYVIRVRRVGFEPYVSAKFAIGPADTASIDVRAPSSRITLPTVTVSAKECRRGARGRQGAVAATIWTQLQTALASSEIARAERLENFAIRRFERVLDRAGKVTAEQERLALNAGNRPFVSVPAADLSREGYVVADSMGFTVFRAPDAGVLLSDEFARDHCFSVVTGRGSTVGFVGLAFSPVPDRRVTDIEGTMWADPESAELRLVEYAYVPRRRDWNGVGGFIRFERLPSSHWIVRDWVLRMPVVTQRLQLMGYREEGGEAEQLSRVAAALADSIANARAVPGRVQGTAWDSIGNVPFQGAKVWLDSAGAETGTDALGTFVFPRVIPGRHTIHFSHPMLDSMGIPRRTLPVVVGPDSTTLALLGGPSLATLKGSACDDTTAVVTGTVRDARTGAPVDSADVTLSWIDIAFSAGKIGRIDARDLHAPSDTAGRYAACVPPHVEISLLARVAGARTGRVDVRPDQRRLAIADFFLDRDTQDTLTGAAILRGIVKYQDATPLPNATITLTDPERTATSDASGSFRIAGIPAGTRVIDTRAVGHAPMRTVVQLRPGDTTTVSVYMRKVQMLDPIFVRSSAGDRATRVFRELEERRRRGLGYRLDQLQLVAFRGARMENVLRALPFVRLSPRIRTVALSNGRGGLCEPDLWVDDRHLPLDAIDFVTVSDVISIEAFTRASDVPLRYQGFSRCGAIVVVTKHLTGES